MTATDRQYRPSRPLWPLIPLALLAMLAGSLIGTTHLDLMSIWQEGTRDFHIFWNLRLPQVLVAFLAGSGLALCGMSFQALFLNTLATPYTLGVAGGASWGASFVIFLGGLPGLAVSYQVSLGAMGGAGLAMALIIVFSRSRMGHQRHVMLLAGVAVSFFFSSLLLLTMALSSMYQSFQITRWLMGGIRVAGYREVLLLSPVVIPGLVVLLFQGTRLNMLLLGDDLARSRGLNVIRTKHLLFLVVSLMVATIVSVTGPIGFVGMVIPHICRLVWGGDHKRLGPASFMAGGIMLVLCDLVARLLLPPSGLPVGVLTAMIGSPFFFILLWRRRYRF